MTKCNSGDPHTAYHQTKYYECTVERELGYNSCCIDITEIGIFVFFSKVRDASLWEESKLLRN